RRRARRWRYFTGYAPFGRRGRVLDSCAKGASALNAPALNASPGRRRSNRRGPASKSRLPAFVWARRKAAAAAQSEPWSTVLRRPFSAATSHRLPSGQCGYFWFLLDLRALRLCFFPGGPPGLPEGVLASPGFF